MSFSPRSADLRRLTSCILLLGLLTSLSTATCYWQNSALNPDSPDSIAQDDTACFPAQENSPCCGTGWSCLSDGVCMIRMEEQDFYYRGTCTDKMWTSQQCPSFCFAQNSNSSIPLAKCTGTQDWYCCPGDPECSCETGKNAVKLGGEQPSTVTVIGSTTWPGLTSATSTVPFTSQVLNVNGTSTVDAAGTFSATASSMPSGSQLAAEASSTSTNSASQSSENSGSSTSHTGLAVGLGVGLGIAVVVIAVLAWFFVRRKNKRGTTNGASGYEYEKTRNTESFDNSQAGAGVAGHNSSRVKEFFSPVAKKDDTQYKAYTPPVEMDDSQGVRAELPASTRQRYHEMQG